MGSYNQTCAVSQFPITSGDPVVGLLLVETGNDIGHLPAGYSGTSALWSIASMPFYGVYEDSGFPDITDATLANDPDFRIGDKSLLEMFEFWHEENEDIQVKTYTGDLAAVRFVLMHRGIWDKFADHPIGFVRATTYQDERDTLPAILDLWEAKTAERWSEGVLGTLPASDRPKLDMGLDLRHHWWRGDHQNKRAKGIRFFSSEAATYHPLVMGVTNHLSKCLAAGDRSGALNVLEECMRLSIVDEALSFLNRQWIPQVLGGQQTHAGLHSALATWTLEMVRQDRAKYDEDGYDEGEPEPLSP